MASQDLANALNALNLGVSSFQTARDKRRKREEEQAAEKFFQDLQLRTAELADKRDQRAEELHQQKMQAFIEAKGTADAIEELYGESPELAKARQEMADRARDVTEHREDRANELLLREQAQADREHSLGRRSGDEDFTDKSRALTLSGQEANIAKTRASTGGAEADRAFKEYDRFVKANQTKDPLTGQKTWSSPRAQFFAEQLLEKANSAAGFTPPPAPTQGIVPPEGATDKKDRLSPGQKPFDPEGPSLSGLPFAGILGKQKAAREQGGTSLAGDIATNTLLAPLVSAGKGINTAQRGLQSALTAGAPVADYVTAAGQPVDLSNISPGEIQERLKRGLIKPKPSFGNFLSSPQANPTGRFF
jgi:hypothetical protein